GILNQLGHEEIGQLKRYASGFASNNLISKSLIEDDDEVPDLVGNFDDASKEEVVAKGSSEEKTDSTEKPVVVEENAESSKK
ncbi:hypothetical protein INO35_14460, partial [Staphylococcus aureus]|nr:hypothetical protein [Staphylococcus aureus]